MKNISKVKWTNEMECPDTPITFAIKMMQDLILANRIGAVASFWVRHIEEQEFRGFFG